MYPHHQNAIVRRNSSSSSSFSRKPKLLMRSGRSAEVQPFTDFSSSSINSSSSSSPDNDAFNLPLVGRAWGAHAPSSAATASFNFLLHPFSSVASLFRSIHSLLTPTCQILAASSTTAASSLSPRASRRGRLTGTFFGQKKGRVTFAVQETPRSEPILLLDLATPTGHLVREMASGMVRILLECESGGGTPKRRPALLDEKVWTMYCNGHKLGYATSRPCAASDLHVLGAVQAISVGAGVMPPTAPGSAPALPAPSPTEAVAKNNINDCGGSGGNDVMYMRAKFERVIGSRDSEAFYMINPDCGGGGREGSGGKYSSGGPELSIFLLRI
ncbi:protein MIZU-KUSSEI 1-like [Iris pallida]|uniref:Protein MIZU-KUSSEI 1-like n=1 Tax=Iris pallida TaxID=29817 RepID=A0AAX6GT58_IRIPA|nr:protein MIZU-KUSSEI 1-like [Iris pallida]